MPKITVTVQAYKFGTFARSNARSGQSAEGCYARLTGHGADGRAVSAVAWDDSARHLDRSLASLTPASMSPADMGFVLELTGEERDQARSSGERRWTERVFQIDRNDGFILLTGPAQEMHRARISAVAAHGEADGLAQAGDYKAAYQALQAFVARFARIAQPDDAPELDEMPEEPASTVQEPAASSAGASSPGASPVVEGPAPAMTVPAAGVAEEPSAAVAPDNASDQPSMSAPGQDPVSETAGIQTAEVSAAGQTPSVVPEASPAPETAAAEPAGIQEEPSSLVSDAVAASASPLAEQPVAAMQHEVQTQAEVPAVGDAAAPVPPATARTSPPRRRSSLAMSLGDLDGRTPNVAASTDDDDGPVAAAAASSRTVAETPAVLPAESPELAAARDMGVKAAAPLPDAPAPVAQAPAAPAAPAAEPPAQSAATAVAAPVAPRVPGGMPMRRTGFSTVPGGAVPPPVRRAAPPPVRPDPRPQYAQGAPAARPVSRGLPPPPGYAPSARR